MPIFRPARRLLPAAPILLALLSAATPSHGAAQARSDSIPFLPPEIHRVDGSTLLPHRLELEETTRYPGDSTDLDSFTYVSVTPAQGWDELQLAIDWVGLTWNGTGYDHNLVAQEGLALRGRVTPSGVPFGHYVGTHYYPGVSNLVDVNPDGDLHRYATVSDRASGVHNEIIYPYLLSRMELSEGASFVVPAFNPYRARAPLQYRLFVVRERVVIEDEEGHKHSGWRVDGVSANSYEEARALAGKFPEGHARYYVSADPPYFLGKEWRSWPDGQGRKVDKRWRLTGHEILTITPARRMEEILRVRARRGAGQVIPWRNPVK